MQSQRSAFLIERPRFYRRAANSRPLNRKSGEQKMTPRPEIGIPRGPANLNSAIIIIVVFTSGGNQQS